MHDTQRLPAERKLPIYLSSERGCPRCGTILDENRNCAMCSCVIPYTRPNFHQPFLQQAENFFVKEIPIRIYEIILVIAIVLILAFLAFFK